MSYSLRYLIELNQWNGMVRIEPFHDLSMTFKENSGSIMNWVRIEKDDKKYNPIGLDNYCFPLAKRKMDQLIVSDKKYIPVIYFLSDSVHKELESHGGYYFDTTSEVDDSKKTRLHYKWDS